MRLARSPWALWAAFLLVHAELWLANLLGPGNPLGDVTFWYASWDADTVAGGPIPGVDVSWVYPQAALLPILLAGVAGKVLYAYGWLAVVTLADAAAFAVLTHRRRARPVLAAWWWLAALLALGPVALGRLDGVSAAVAVAAAAILATRPTAAGALLALGAWIKVWPAAVLAAALIALRARLRLLLGAAAVTAAVILVALGLRSHHLFSFIGTQTGRGLQLESPLATPWLWVRWFAPDGDVRIYYDETLSTWQVAGPGTALVAQLSTAALAVAVLAAVGAGLRAARRRTDAPRALAALSLALVAALIAFNKVGSPQYETWYAAPLVLGILAAPRRFRLPAAVMLAASVATQLVYPFNYGELVGAQPWAVVVITARNLAELWLYGWALRASWRVTART